MIKSDAAIVTVNPVVSFCFRKQYEGTGGVSGIAIVVVYVQSSHFFVKD